MSFFRWRRPCTFKYPANARAHDVLVWRDSIGVHLLEYQSREWFRFSCDGDGWELWREVPEPSQKEIDKAKRAGEREKDFK